MSSSFTTPLRVEAQDDGRTWAVCEAFCYYTDVPAPRYLITVPAGTLTDFASTPRALWWLFPPWGRYGKAAVVHDFLYKLKMFSRGHCDRIFLEAMVVLKVSWATRTTMYSALRAFGWIAWRRTPRVLAPAPGAYMTRIENGGLSD